MCIEIQTENFARSYSIKQNLFQNYRDKVFAQNAVILCTNGMCYLPENMKYNFGVIDVRKKNLKLICDEYTPKR